MSNSEGLSKEHEQFYRFMRCPLCKQFPIVPKYFNPDRHKIPPTTRYQNMDRLAVAECPMCHGRWSVFSSPQSGVVRQATGTITVKANSSEQLTGQQFRNSKIKDSHILEREKIQEYLGSELKSIDNSKSAISLKRNFTISKEWSQDYKIEFEKMAPTTEEGVFEPFELSNIELDFKKALEDKYSISENVKLVYREEIELEVPEHTKLRVYFQWKRIWQHGAIRFHTYNDREFEIPYRVASGITFDQKQIDEK